MSLLSFSDASTGSAPAQPRWAGASAHPSAGYALSRTQKGVILFLVTFLLMFPKGGIKVAGVPLTWGYLGMAPLFVVLSVLLFLGEGRSIRASRLLVLGALLPFQLVAYSGLLVNGVTSMGMGFAISFVVTFYFIPLMMVAVLGIYLDRIDLSFFFRLFRFAILFVSAYGIFLFFYKLLTGSFLEIPYLTVNAGDVGSLEGKYINRGGIFKLISTYNNGNIYGISIAMLLPLYCWLEKSTAKKTVVMLSLVLTLSRTVWVGLLFAELLRHLYVKRVSVRTVAVLVPSMLLLVAGVLYTVQLIGLDPGSFLFDRGLGGRRGQWLNLDETTLLPGVAFDAIAEMVYLSVLHKFGLVGLATFLVGMVTPLVLFRAGAVPQHSTPYKRSIAVGLTTWLFMALGDGAILYIPVGVIYWFLVSLLLSDNASAAGAEEHAMAESAPAGVARPSLVVPA